MADGEGVHPPSLFGAIWCYFVVITFLCHGDKCTFYTFLALHGTIYARILLHILLYVNKCLTIRTFECFFVNRIEKIVLFVNER